MSTQMMEHEIAALKQRVESLEKQAVNRPRGGWEVIVGKAKDDDLFEEAMKLGAEWRARANAEGHQATLSW